MISFVITLDILLCHKRRGYTTCITMPNTHCNGLSVTRYLYYTRIWWPGSITSSSSYRSLLFSECNLNMISYTPSLGVFNTLAWLPPAPPLQPTQVPEVWRHQHLCPHLSSHVHLEGWPQRLCWPGGCWWVVWSMIHIVILRNYFLYTIPSPQSLNRCRRA